MEAVLGMLFLGLIAGVLLVITGAIQGLLSKRRIAELQERVAALERALRRTERTEQVDFRTFQTFAGQSMPTV